jgi:hypothetical protein
MTENMKNKFDRLYKTPNPWKYDNTIKDISRSEILLEWI